MAEKIVKCEICGIEYPIKVGEYNRKVKNGMKFCCSRSCSGKLGNQKRWVEKTVSPTPEPTLVISAQGEARLRGIYEIVATRDIDGQFMPDSWVDEQVTKQYPKFVWYVKNRDTLAELRKDLEKS